MELREAFERRRSEYKTAVTDTSLFDSLTHEIDFLVDWNYLQEREMGEKKTCERQDTDRQMKMRTIRRMF